MYLLLQIWSRRIQVFHESRDRQTPNKLLEFDTRRKTEKPIPDEILLPSEDPRAGLESLKKVLAALMTSSFTLNMVKC